MNWYLFFDVIAWGWLGMIALLAFLDRRNLARNHEDLFKASIMVLFAIAYLIARL